MDNLTSLSDHSDYLSASTYSDSERWQLHRKRVEFGKQPLELWQFVPCKLVAGVWVVLEEPKSDYEPTDFWNAGEVDEKHNELYGEYQEAKDRVLFEGFEIKDFETYKTIKLKDFDFNILWNKGCELGWYLSIGIKTIEDISKYNLQLTKTTKKTLEL